MGHVADYVLGLVEEILGEAAEREKRFSWAVGDPSVKTGRCVELPFDAVWASRRLIIEVDEDQHRRAVTFGAPVELGVKSSGQVDDDPRAAEVDESDERLGGVEAEAAVADEPDTAVETFETAV